MFVERSPFADEEAWPAPLDPALYTVIPSRAEVPGRSDETAAAAAILPPGADVLSSLEAVFADQVSDAGLIDALVACRRQLAALEAKQLEFLAEIARRDRDGEAFLREEVGPALRLAPATAAQRIAVAGELTGRLAKTRALMRSGVLSGTHGRILAAACENLSDEITAEVQTSVLGRAGSQTPGEFRASVRRAVAYLDRKNEKQRHQDASTRRRVVKEPDADGMSWLHLYLADDGAAIVLAAVNAWATRTGPDDERTADQRRADAAVELALAALAVPGLPAGHGLKANVNITLAATTLTGDDDQPGLLDGDPVPATIARRLARAADGPRHYWPVDATGQILEQPCTHLATGSYTPPARLARHVIFRDQHCVWPGCRRRARTCELDHRTPWPQGPTSAANLQALCKKHHDAKHRSRWQVHRTEDATYHWTSPTRHTYRYRPPPQPVPAPPQPPPPVDNTPPPF